MVTKIKLKAFMLLIILFLIALFVGGTFVYGIFIITALILAASFISGKSTNKNLISIVWKNNDKMQAGSKLNLSMELYNSGIFPIAFLRLKSNLSRKLTGEEEKAQIYSVMPGEKVIIEKNIICKTKGIYKIGHLEAEYGDALGIFNWKKVFDTDILLYVYPKIHALKSFSIPLRHHFGTVAVRHNAYEDFASIRDIRKYASGDSLKKVHWKVTAHKNEFHVKNVELNATAELNVFLDLYQENYQGKFADEMEEAAAECAASVIRYALSKNMPVSYIAKSDSFIKVSGMGLSRFNEFLDAITRSEVCGDTPVWELVRNEGQKLNLGATAVIITLSVNELLLQTLLTFKAKGIGFVLIYLCEDRNVLNNNIEILKEHNIKVYVLGLHDDLLQVLGGHYER